LTPTPKTPRKAQGPYTVYANVEQREASGASRHRTLKAAGKAYQAAHSGNLRRVLDALGRDATHAACDAANGGL
jgi:hypothetical protein